MRTLTASTLLQTACGRLHGENAFPLVWLVQLQALQSLPEASPTPPNSPKRRFFSRSRFAALSSSAFNPGKACYCKISQRQQHR